jgi:ERCC4-type nuclease
MIGWMIIPASHYIYYIQDRRLYSILHICIDSRESKEIKEWLPKQFKDIKFEVKALKEGDYESKSILAERKQISDLWSSIADGRFHSQLDRISTHQDKILIYLITGDINKWYIKERAAKRYANMETIHGAIASLIARNNIRVLIDPDDHNGLKRMVKIIRRIEEDGVNLFPSARDPDCLTARLLNIDLLTWKELKKVYGSSLKYISTLSRKDLEKVPGIGPAKAKAIITVLDKGWE